VAEEARKRLEEYESSLRRVRELRIANIEDLWVEYDRQSDTLYIGFGREEAEESILLEGNITVLIKGDKLVGIIIEEFSSRIA